MSQGRNPSSIDNISKYEPLLNVELTDNSEVKTPAVSDKKFVENVKHNQTQAITLIDETLEIINTKIAPVIQANQSAVSNCCLNCAYSCMSSLRHTRSPAIALFCCFIAIIPASIGACISCFNCDTSCHCCISAEDQFNLTHNEMSTITRTLKAAGIQQNTLANLNGEQILALKNALIARRKEILKQMNAPMQHHFFKALNELIDEKRITTDIPDDLKMICLAYAVTDPAQSNLPNSGIATAPRPTPSSREI